MKTRRAGGDNDVDSGMDEDHDITPPGSPFCGFTNADIPQPIVIVVKNEPEGEEATEEDCEVVEVKRADRPLPPVIVKKEIEDDDDVEFFYGFNQNQIPKPIIIKAEPEDDDVIAERSTTMAVVDSVGHVVNVPGDDLIDEFETDLFIVDKVVPASFVGQNEKLNIGNEPILEVRSQSSEPSADSPEKTDLQNEIKEVDRAQQDDQESIPENVQTKPPTSDTFLAKTEGNTSTSQLEVISAEILPDRRVLKKGTMQIIEAAGHDENEDREYTVIVEDTDDVTADNQAETAVIEADSIEDILAQFETESAPQSVNCPNCRKCFVSAHFLNLHIANASTMCDLCSTQCCSAVNLRNHKNLECDLSKRRRNIDLIAQETALMGRKPISPEKYYNMGPEEDEDDEMNEIGPSKAKKFGNEVKYECGVCGKHVKILDSHMKFIHGMEGGARSNKYKCPECGLLVTSLQRHVARVHGPNAQVVDDTDEVEDDVIRCRHPGCELFFNTTEEVQEHAKREHAEEVRLACGMGGCDEVFDNRGALKRHRVDSHPELDEFKPVDLEPDDPDRSQDLTVACPVCERKFKHKNTCTIHIKTNHLGWTKRKLFECPDCFHMFENKKEVDRHREAVHLGIRTVCPLCDKPVTRLDLHVRMVHTDLPEWPCPDCGKKFKRKFDLNRHRVTVHLGVRNFPCDLCGKRFADMKDMTRHKNAVHYGMKIRWNTNKNKNKGSGSTSGSGGGGRGGGRKSNKTNSVSSQEVKLEEGTVTIPVEYIETVETTDQMQESAGSLEGSTVILDPVLQSQLAAVHGGPGEPRVLIEPDPDNSGGLRFVVIQEEDAEHDEVVVQHG